jgi:hypothetical protein
MNRTSSLDACTGIIAVIESELKIVQTICRQVRVHQPALVGPRRTHRLRLADPRQTDYHGQNHNYQNSGTFHFSTLSEAVPAKIVSDLIA